MIMISAFKKLHPIQCNMIVKTQNIKLDEDNMSLWEFEWYFSNKYIINYGNATNTMKLDKTIKYAVSKP